jgi:hypothetical protein
MHGFRGTITNKKQQVFYDLDESRQKQAYRFGISGSISLFAVYTISTGRTVRNNI